jgi:hypothetical protein
MPPSQETPLEKKDIGNTNLNPDISESVSSTARKTPTSNNSLIVSKPPAGKDKGNSKVSFLILPIEIRLQIYEILLISHTDEKPKRNYNHGLVHFKILQTCRPIYREGNSILYSQNKFRFHYVDCALEFIEQIGPVNFRSISSLCIRVAANTTRSAFLGLFNILAEEENGVWVMEYTYGPYVNGNCGRVSGTGDKLDFTRTLEKTEEIRRELLEAFISLQDGRYQLFCHNCCRICAGI